MKMDKFGLFEQLRSRSASLRCDVDTLECYKKMDEVVVRIGSASVILTKKEYNRMFTPIIKRIDKQVTEMITEAEAL